jgi:hypothetical protein
MRLPIIAAVPFSLLASAPLDAHDAAGDVAIERGFRAG